MMIYAIFGIVILGILTSYTDIRYGKIRNWHMILFSAYAALLMVLLKTPIKDAALNAAIALVVGILLWILSFWTAGDAKLFLVYALLAFSADKTSYLQLLIFTFIPFFLVFSAYAVYKSGRFSALMTAFSQKKLFDLAVALFSLQWLVRFIPGLDGIFSSFIVLSLIYVMLERLKLNNTLVFSVIAVIRVFADISILDMSFAIRFFSMLLMLALLKYIFLEVSYDAFSRNVRTKDLKPGMIPAETIDFQPGHMKKEPAPFFGLAKKKALFELKPEGLDENDIAQIKKSEARSIKIYETLPFAPFMFIGVLLAIMAF